MKSWANTLVEGGVIIVLVLLGFGIIGAGCWGCQVDCRKDDQHHVNPAWCKER